MNKKEELLNKIVEIVAQCCSQEDDITSDNLISLSRSENLVMSRCILVSMLQMAGFTIGSVSKLLNRTPQAIRNMYNIGFDFRKVSHAYRIAEAEATIKVNELIGKEKENNSKETDEKHQ